MEIFNALTSINTLVNIIFVILILVLLWLLIRYILRLTVKVFSCGCSLIVLIGVVVLMYNFLLGS